MSESLHPLKRGSRPGGEAISLESLSNEILIMILKSVFTPLPKLCECDLEYTPSSNKTILNIALCSRRLFKVAEPFLVYQHEYTGSFTDDSLPVLLCRLLAKPDMKKHLYKIQTRAQSAGDGDADMYGNRYPSTDISMIQADDWQRIREAVHAYGSSTEESTRWVDDIESGNWDGFIALLLSISPNIQELHIAGWGEYDAEHPFLTAVLERATGLQKRSIISAGSLSNLKAVSLSYWDTEGGMDMSCLSMFLGIPSVTSINGCMFDVLDQDDDEFPGIIPYVFFTGPSIRRLDLHKSSLSPRSFIRIMHWFPHLEQLSYAHHDFNEFSPPAILAGLKHLEPYLQELTLSYHGETDFSDLINFPIGNLATFQKLRYLDLSQTLLIGSDKAVPEDDGWGVNYKTTQDLVTSLPPNLEHLCIRDYDREIVEPVFELITKKDRYTPALKFLDLSVTKIIPRIKQYDFTVKRSVFTKEEGLKLLAGCKAAGVEMVLTRAPSPAVTVKLFI